MLNTNHSQYIHQAFNGQAIDLPLGKVVCVGRNYLMHIHELNNAVPDKPLLFIKPSTSLVALAEPIEIPQDLGECHNEIELAILISQTLIKASEQQVEQAIWGYGLALDLTLRDVQDSLKRQGHPWERAKAFDGSCPLSPFVLKAQIKDHQNVNFALKVNGQVRQQGNTQDMLVGINALLSEISQTFTLLPGDIVLTGTPKGVGPLYTKDQLEIELHGQFSITTEVK
ncbi:fumarylacetoacetate hydrolase family protein [Paraglaciecola hydrolytica]|uniref:Isomerase/hydrolase n=1 Tax=Paraglaciecola hydrolytica TaxID=1799789 RepID=A0A136A0D0_9ALTE|nr:fumarylacetoacetate hydrolase family protein [Paraglaciecola hydrolytica]KXI28672.1 isomerase/hydrolase [Paraglaciecola hydrolytica]